MKKYHKSNYCIYSHRYRSSLTQTNDAKAFFSYEWKGLEIAKNLADQAKKDDGRADKLIKEADEKRTL